MQGASYQVAAKEAVVHCPLGVEATGSRDREKWSPLARSLSPRLKPVGGSHERGEAGYDQVSFIVTFHQSFRHRASAATAAWRRICVGLTASGKA